MIFFMCCAMIKEKIAEEVNAVNFDHIAPNVQSIYLYRKKPSARMVTHRKFSYTHKLIIILEGSMILRIGDREERCETGDVIYMPARQDYITDFPCPLLRLINLEFDMIQDRAQEATPLKTNFVYADEIQMTEYFSTEVAFDDLPAFNTCFVLHHFPGAVKRAQRCLELYGSCDQYTHLILNTQITELLIRIAEHIGKTQKTSTAVVAERVMDYVEAHYMEKLTCGKVASVFSYHPASLNRIMREFCGCSLHEAITRAKINGAIQLLMESDMSITDIAYHLSFYDSAHFTKTFQEVTGRNPSDMRKKEW